MAEVKILSVRPAEKTLGALHPEIAESVKRIARFNVLSDQTESRLRNKVDFIFAVNRDMSKEMSRKVAVVRLLTGILLTVVPLLGLSSATFPVSILMSLAGAMITIGCMTRFASIAVVAMMAFNFVNMFNAGMPDYSALFSMIPFMGFALIGAGHFSLDAILRYKIYRSIRLGRERSLARLRMSYNAYSTLS